MTPALAELIVNGFTLACQGKYEPVSSREIVPAGHICITKSTDPVILGNASFSTDLEALSIFYSRLGDHYESLCCGSLAIGVQHFLASHIRSILETIKNVHIHTDSNGTIYVHEEKLPMRSAKWEIPSDCILTTWSEKLLHIMQEGFNHDQPPVQEEINWSGVNFTIKPRDPRIVKVHEICQAVEVAKMEFENKDQVNREICMKTYTYLLELIRYMIYATTNLPNGYAPASIGIKENLITGQIYAE